MFQRENNQQVTYTYNAEAVTTSLQVAEVFGKAHKSVIRKIEQIKEENDSAQNCSQCFRQSFYTDASGKRNPMYYINRDGFSLYGIMLISGT